MFIERGVSGTKPLAERPQGAELLAVLQPGDAIIASKLDRVFRSALDALTAARQLRKLQIALHLPDLGGDVTTNGNAKLFFTMASAFAEAERDRLQRPITEVKRLQRKRRYLGGTAPWGWRVGEAGELEPIPEQQAAIRHMRRLREEGKSLRTIARMMAAAGISISHAGVKNALADERNTSP
jgi:DNA invertase Pin-like site-specific DNA recombinase